MNAVIAAALAVTGTLWPVVAVAQAPAWTDPSPHQVRFVTVAPDVKLEVLDWGGTGRDVVLLTGSGHTAHVYDEFALKLKDCCRVYGVTRRGYGASSQPTTGYDEPSLGHDVWTVIDTFGLRAPVVIGHSMAGAELTDLGMKHSDRLGGLVGTGRPARDYSKIKVPVLAVSDAVDFDLSHLKPEQPQPRTDDERAIVMAFGKATVGRLAKVDRGA